jgi:hypothetical protein
MSEKFLLKTAPQLDVHKWSDYPEVNAVVDAIFEEIKKLRKLKNKRIREANKVKKHLKVIIIDLWAANKLSLNPYRSISKNKSDFQIDSRYQRIYLKYDYFVGVINDLVELKYIKEKKGYRFANDAKRTRIKADNKLIDKILSASYGVNEVIKLVGLMPVISSQGEAETIILRDVNGNLVEYEDTDSTIIMRDKLRLINNKLNQTRISLDITDQQYVELQEKINTTQDQERRTIDFTNFNLNRVFNNSSWSQGGRFYGGWWQNIPKEYRKYIDINHKPTVELDYSGHHIRMLYASEGLAAPEDPYDLTEFEREDQKLAVLTMLNASDKNTALKAMAYKGILKARILSIALSERHSQIQQHFFTGVGLNLMYQDSQVAEKVMLQMLDRGATVLPVHDSFIVRNSYSDELEEVMKNVFEEQYMQGASLKYKKTMLEEVQTEHETNGHIQVFVSNDLTHTLADRLDNYKWNIGMWGL